LKEMTGVWIIRAFKDADNDGIYLDTYTDGYVHLMVSGAGGLNGVLVTPATARQIANHMLKLADKVQANRRKEMSNE